MKMTRAMRCILATFVLAMSAALGPRDAVHAGVPGSKAETNTDSRGIALQGYDPVAYFTTGTPTRGLASIVTSYNGAKYLFASETDRKLFVDNPRKFAPEFGGFCVVGTAYGQKVDIDPETGVVVQGKLYLNNNAKAFALFQKDTLGMIDRAEKNWGRVKDQAL